MKNEPTLLPPPPNTKQTKTNPGSAGFAPGWTFLFRKRSPCLCELAAPALMGRVLPLDRPVPGLVWFLSVPGTWEKSNDQEIFGAEQSLESPALAPSFRGAEGLVTPPSPPVATGDARVSVQPQGAHAPTYLRRGRWGAAPSHPPPPRGAKHWPIRGVRVKAKKDPEPFLASARWREPFTSPSHAAKVAWALQLEAQCHAWGKTPG